MFFSVVLFRVRPTGLASIKWTVELSPYGPFLELHWADITNVSMSALTIVKTFDVVEHISPRLISGAVLAPLGPFPFQTGKEALYYCIVVATTGSTQTTTDTVLF